jgi:hypothetical protein
LKAIFVGDSAGHSSEFLKSLENSASFAPVIARRCRPFSVDFGGKVLP